MGTLLLDFDSTLVPVESLELVLAAGVAGDRARLREVEALTRLGMEGDLDFRASLEARLAIAPPHRDTAHEVGLRLRDGLTHGAEACVGTLHEVGHVVRIVSGGLREVILPTAERLGIPPGHLHAVGVHWNAAGGFEGLIEDGFPDSKVEGVRALAERWPRPVVAVGDGATDHALLAAGIADVFVAFTGHIRRAFLDEADLTEVTEMDALRELLLTLLARSRV
ncbi:MAG: haloacid dehalogenase-like hydrolase [Longimicrobiales bacterium]|nr:haloacid dehalogenase-like hydrolase [Longimicrobiales bacterium]